MHNNKVSNLKALLHGSKNTVCARTKRVLAIGGLDPSGAAGLVADISTLARVNCRPGALVTAHTVQGLSQWGGLRAVDSFLFRTQAQALQDGPTWDAIKIGALGSAEIASEVCLLLRDLRLRQPELPIVLDPVIRSTSGGELGRAEWFDELLELVTLICPNQAEQQELPARRNSATYTLITDHPPGAILTQGGRQIAEFPYTREPGDWRGTGCRLGSLIAAALASGLEVTAGCAWALQTLGSWIHEAAAAPADRVEHHIL